MRLNSRFLCVRVPARSRRLLSQRLIPPLGFGGRVQPKAFCIVDNNGSITQKSLPTRFVFRFNNNTTLYSQRYLYGVCANDRRAVREAEHDIVYRD